MRKNQSWREIGALFLLSFGIIAPFLLLTQVSGIKSVQPISSQNWRQIAENYIGAYFALAAGSFTFCVCLSVIFGFMRLMIDKVPPPFPVPSKDETEAGRKDNHEDWL